MSALQYSWGKDRFSSNMVMKYPFDKEAPGVSTVFEKACTVYGK